MRLRRATSLLIAGLMGSMLAAGLPVAAYAAEKKEEKKGDHKGDHKGDAHGKAPAPKPEPEKFEPLPIVEPAKLPSGRNAFDMMRELRQLQDKVANGDADSMLALRPLIEKMAEEFEKADDAVWLDPRNGRAVLAYVLSGGDVKVLRALLLRGQPKGIDQNLGRAIHAFASNRRGDALDLFTKLEPMDLDASIAGQVALAQAEFFARTDLAKALEKLDVARLLGPGTLLEEAALRRKISLLSGQKRFAEADRAMEIYFRRFPRSGYSGSMKRQVVRFVSERPPLEGEAQTQPIVDALNRLGQKEQIEMYVEMAKEAVARSRRDVVNFAASKSLALAEQGSLANLRSRIYLASMKVASMDAEKVKASLEEIKMQVAGKEELELIAATQSIADEIRRVATVTPTDVPDPSWNQELGKTFTNVGKAQGLLADADRILAEANR